MNFIENYIQKVFAKVLNAKSEPIKRKKISSGKQIEEADLYRETFTIPKWADAVEQAEYVDFPDRIELARFYKNLVDDDTVWQCMDVRTKRSVKGKMSVQDKYGNEIKGVTDIFFKPDGNPLKWFRDWLELQIKAQFYGAILINFSDIKNGKFENVKMVDYQNVIPEKSKIILNTDMGIWGDNSNMADIDKKPISNWCYIVDDGDLRSLGLLNKAAPYYIWKNDALGNWAMFLDIFGVDMLLGKTDTTDPNRRDAMDVGLSNGQSGRYMTVDTDDEVEVVSSSNTDTHSTFREPAKYYDNAINKIFLGQTSLSEDKSFVGSAEIQAETGDDIIFFDKLEISDNFENQLIPFMQNLGMIPEGEYFLIHDIDEKLSKVQWADIIQKVSAKKDVPTDELERIFGVKFEDVETDTNLVETANNVYKTILNGKN